jgi:hypothetical protein
VTVFSSTEEAETIFGDFFDQISLDPALRPKFVAAATSFRANYSDPEVAISLDSTVDPPVVKRGPEARAATVEVEMNMSTDDGHKFWLGELNIPMAMARRKVTVQGPVGNLMKLLPAMQPAFSIYRTFLEERGLASKLDA